MYYQFLICTISFYYVGVRNWKCFNDVFTDYRALLGVDILGSIFMVFASLGLFSTVAEAKRASQVFLHEESI